MKPCKIKLLGEGYVFRQNNPAIVGVEIMAGTITSNMPLMTTEGVEVTSVKGIRLETENIESATRGARVSASLTGITIGRQIQKDSTLYSNIPEAHFRKYKEFKDYLRDDEKELLKEIALIMRVKNPVWGI